MLSMENKLKKYEKIKFLGEGQFATVYQARDVDTDNIVAVKKIKIGSRQEAQDGINRTALREIKLLQELHHTNIIGLLDVFGHMSNVSLVFDFMDTDLEVLHRDLKPNNLLVNSSGILKVGDFGLAKLYGSPNRINTHQVVTRWYRAPELLFGAKQYSTCIDMWAVGCILAELLLRVPLFQGESDLDQLTKIFDVFGNPTEENWPGLKTLSDFIEFKPFNAIPLKLIFTAAGDDLLELIQGLLVLNPIKRKTCSECLQMPFFSNKPAPTIGTKLPLPQSLRNNRDNDKPTALKRKMMENPEGGNPSKRLLF
ncbi:cyclin-dependent kinase 7 isoform X2 [Diabrotica virgifera virgifera]|uniref:Cyclin-dependent kinase 7 n=1 Tax=Diabrotica virgifera virgifera TaxID=50390 RepID=A0A6P7G5I8_DIAVI|nr:cyclin-dependent kinase 7 isoform X2 [Diabrotica virgifera virgifera]